MKKLEAYHILLKTARDFLRLLTTPLLNIKIWPIDTALGASDTNAQVTDKALWPLVSSIGHLVKELHVVSIVGLSSHGRLPDYEASAGSRDW